VQGSDCTSRNNNRPRGVVEAFQVREHIVEAHRDVTSNIFRYHPSWSCLLNNSAHFRPEVAVIFCAAPLPNKAEWLAWVSTGNKFNVSKQSPI
jgi:hypothetical protein